MNEQKPESLFGFPVVVNPELDAFDDLPVLGDWTPGLLAEMFVNQTDG